MSSSNHPIEPEELMAYLDGELATDRAVEAAAHMDRCADCQELAAELRKISQEMMAWEVDESETAEMPDEIVAALALQEKQPKKIGSRQAWRLLFTGRRLALAGGVASLFLLVLAVFTPNVLRSTHAPMKSLELSRGRQQVAEGLPVAPSDGVINSNGNVNYYNGVGQLKSVAPSAQPSAGSAGKPRAAESGDEIDENESKPSGPMAPMIARTAALTLVAKEFDKTRAGLEEILKRHNGYVGELNVSAPSDAGRTLTATLRIPGPQLEAALAELKQLGRVENESQGGEEVTQQYVDLEARLKNAQHTEQRLTEMLSQRTGKLQDVLKVELEIDRVRGEIEQMQAEKKALAKRVAFATLNTVVKEEYHARLEAAPPSTSSRFRNAAVDGYNAVVEGFIAVALFLLSAGPALLVWGAILFFPVRWLWRKVRAELKMRDEQAA